MTNKPRPPQFKFNNLFIKQFPWQIFFFQKYFVEQKLRNPDRLLFKVGKSMVTNHVSALRS